MMRLQPDKYRTIALLTTLTFFSVMVFFSGNVYSIEIPPRSNYLVNDYAGILSEREKNSLENKLVAFDDSTSTQIAIVIIKTLDGYPIADYSIKLYEQWGIGQTRKDNGLLILISHDERKIWITTGYGLEGAVPDIMAKRIIENDISPFFKREQYYEGLNKATTSIMNLVKGEYTSDNLKKGKKQPFGFGFFILLFIILLVLFFRVRSVRRFAALNDIPFWIAWGLLNSIGRKNRGKWGDFSSGSGSFGGFSGFGGFGGGRTGGGGAGGSW